jgi:hypothetical protein
MKEMGKYAEDTSLDSLERWVQGKKSRKSLAWSNRLIMEFMTKEDEEKTGDGGAGCLTELAETERGLSITLVLRHFVPLHLTEEVDELSCCVYR